MRNSDSATVESLEVRDVVPGGAPEVLVKTSASFDHRGTLTSEVTSLRVVGIGASGRPAATPAILVEQSAEELDDEGETLRKSGGSLRVTFDAEGILDVKPGKKVGAGLPKDTLGALVGKHSLAFP
jgi:hypothetical protein